MNDVPKPERPFGKHCREQSCDWLSLQPICEDEWSQRQARVNVRFLIQLTTNADLYFELANGHLWIPCDATNQWTGAQKAKWFGNPKRL